MKIYTAYHASPLGKLKIQCSEEYVSAVLFYEQEDEEASHHPLLQECIIQLDEYFSGTRNAFELPLQQEGTPFQQRVWELLLEIPFGKTISYHQLAKQHGDLKAIRAVASANGKNNIAIIVPCHRVIGSNQSLTGYAGGLWRKKWLLEHEAKHYAGVQQLGLAFN
jgi:methylated-DNA-[protein]-cysteine S-methyltransferase